MPFNLVPPKTDMISYDLLQTHSSVYDWKMENVYPKADTKTLIVKVLRCL